MKNLKKTFLGLIDTGANQAKTLVESFNDIVNSFDMDAQLEYLKERKQELIKKSNELFNDFSDLIKQVKDSLVDFSVTVPYDGESGEKISYDIVDGKLIIEVTYSDDTTTNQHKTSVLIPSNCNLDEIRIEENKTKKCVTITIPKNLKVKEDVEEPKAEPNTSEETPTYPKYFCETLGTLMFDDEVKDGVTIRHGYPVIEITEEQAKEFVDEMRKKYAPKKEDTETQPSEEPKPKKTTTRKTTTKKKVKEVVEETTPTTETLVEETTKAPVEEQPTEPTNEGTVEEQISSKLTKRLQNNVNRYAKTLKRDEKGRYVRNS